MYKFRGKTKDGNFVYGDLTHLNGNTFIDDLRVDPESVRIMCGVDADVNEVYEGDTLIDESGEEGTAYLDFVVDTEGKHSASYIEFGEKMYYWYKK